MTLDQERLATALIVRAQQGDGIAYAQLLTLLASLARRYARNRFGDVPWLDDVAQETLLTLHTARRTYDVQRPFAPWFYAIVCAAAGIVLFGARSDLAPALGQPVFLATALLAFGTAILSAGATVVLAIPGAERSPAVRITAAILVGLWMTTLIVAIARAGQGFTFGSHELACFSRVIGIGLIPASVLFMMLRRAMPLRLAWTGGLAAVAAAAIGALAVQIVCPLDDPAHALLAHFGPVAVLGATGANVAATLLRSRCTVERRR